MSKKLNGGNLGGSLLLQGDCLSRLKELEDNSIDSMVCDPPYGIEFMSKQWDLAIPSIDIWKECLRVLRPGSFSFILCIPRQDCLSRMMISLEDAGFNINFSSIYWTYATGFPKAMNIGKKIDKRLGKEREVVGINERLASFGNEEKVKENYENTQGKGHFHVGIDFEKARQITAPSSNEAKQMEGSYGGFQPKPAVECIIVVMKPLSEKSYIDQAMKDGKGVTWFDDCRIPYKDSSDYHTPYKADGSQGGNTPLSNLTYDTKDSVKPDEQRFNEGRFPANLLISDDVLDSGKIDKSGNISFNHGEPNKEEEIRVYLDLEKYIMLLLLSVTPAVTHVSFH